MSLDAREYILNVEEALQGRLDRVERKLALKELRRIIENLAFEFSIRQGHVYPRDIDYALALEGLRSPKRAADVLAAARPRYRRRKRQKRTRLVVALLLLAVAAYTVSAVVTSTVSEPVDEWSHAEADPVTRSVQHTFNVSEGYTRLDFELWVWVTNDDGRATVTLLDPDNQPRLQETFTRSGGAYDQGNLPAVPGTWRVVVDYQDAEGSVRLDVNGVRPAQ